MRDLPVKANAASHHKLTVTPPHPPTLFSLMETATEAAHYGSQLFPSEPADLLFCPCGSSEEENGPLSRLRVP